MGEGEGGIELSPTDNKFCRLKFLIIIGLVIDRSSNFKVIDSFKTRCFRDIKKKVSFDEILSPCLL